MGQTYRIGKVATSVRTDAEGILRVTYHATDVVTVYPNGRIDLDHGGWMTPTTKARMNQASAQFGLGFQARQKDFAWYVDIDGATIRFNRQRQTIRLGSDVGRQAHWPAVQIAAV